MSCEPNVPDDPDGGVTQRLKSRRRNCCDFGHPVSKIHNGTINLKPLPLPHFEGIAVAPLESGI
jgi:hypothetical protein